MGVERLQPGQVEDPVGSPSREDAHLPAVGGDSPVMLQAVGGIVRGAEDFDVPALEQSPARVFGRLEPARARFVDAGRGAGVEDVIDPESALQLQVRPVVERVAQRVGHGFGPLLELGVIARRARTVLLLDAQGAHGAPLVVVVLEPDLGQRAVAVIAGDLGGRQMVVKIDDRQILRVLMVEPLGFFCLQQELFGDERLHGRQHCPETGASSQPGQPRNSPARLSLNSEDSTHNQSLLFETAIEI